MKNTAFTSLWNPWHGCDKISAGCANCYVYRTDFKYNHDSSIVKLNQSYELPIQKNRQGEYKLKPDKDGIIYTCFTSDFFLDKADQWREKAWQMIKLRQDAKFLIITKRIHRFDKCKPADWGDGYDNVIIGCTVENQKMADYRLPIFSASPIKHKMIICEPLLSPIDISSHLKGINRVIVGGESGAKARVCDYDWVLGIREKCIEHNVSFAFKQTGANFIKNGRVYHIERKFQHTQARKADINFDANSNFI